MTDREMLNCYVKMLPFLGELLGPACEIVVHDVTDNAHSGIIAIENPLSGRAIGDPMTDLGRDIVEQGAYEEKDYLANYYGKAKSINFHSSTFFIKNEQKIIGMLCVNKDMTEISNLRGNIKALLAAFNLENPDTSLYQENLEGNVEDYLQSRVAQAISLSGIAPERMNTKEKIRIVQRLDNDGILKLKGAVAEAARQLSVSIPTIYRYLHRES